MKTLALATNQSYTPTAAATAVGATATPFLDGRDCILRIIKTGLTGTPTILFQTSPDNSTWTTVVTDTTLSDLETNVIIGRYNRVNLSVVGSAGSFSAYLENGA